MKGPDPKADPPLPPDPNVDPVPPDPKAEAPPLDPNAEPVVDPKALRFVPVAAGGCPKTLVLAVVDWAEVMAAL